MEKIWNPAARAFQTGDLELGLRTFMDGVSGRPGAFDALPEAARQRGLDNARELAAETASPDYYVYVPPEQISQIRLPVLLLKGENSPKMFHLIVDRLAECLPDAQQATLPNAAHSMASQNPAAYNEVVMRFLDETSIHLR